jgi:hypothetical protein
VSLSLWSGVALVCLGVVANISGVVEHFRLTQQLSSGTWVPGRVFKQWDLGFCSLAWALRWRFT